MFEKIEKDLYKKGLRSRFVKYAYHRENGSCRSRRKPDTAVIRSLCGISFQWTVFNGLAIHVNSTKPLWDVRYTKGRAAIVPVRIQNPTPCRHRLFGHPA